MRLSSFIRALVRLVCAALILLAAGMIAGGVMLAMLVVVDLVMVLVNAPMQFRGGFLVGMVAFPFWLIGAFAIATGVVLIALGLRLRSLMQAMA